MTGYKRIQLGELAIIRGGKRLLPGEDFSVTETDHPYIRARDIGGGNIEIHEPVFLKERTAQRLARYTVNKGDVCLTIVGANVGDIGVVPAQLDGANLTENAVKITTNSKADQTFLKYTLLSDDALAQMKVLAGGAAQPKLGLYKIETIEIPLPPLPVQRTIAGILSAYDDLIENNRRRVRILEEMARNIYREWFVKFRFPGHETVSFVDSPLGTVPQGWAGRFGDLVTIERNGIDPSEFPSEEFEHFSIPAFDGGRWPAVENGPTILSGKYCVESGCVLLSKLNPRIPRIWLPQPSGQRRAIASTEFLVLRPLPGITAEFIYAKCCSEDFSNRFASLAIGTSTSHQRVKPDNLLSMFNTVPDKAIIARFSSLVGSMLSLSQNLLAKVQNLRRTRDLLLQRLLSGTVNISCADPPESLRRHTETLVELLAEKKERSASAAGPTKGSPSSKPVVQENSDNQLELGDKLLPSIDQTDRSDVLAVIRQVFSDGEPRTRERAIRDVAHLIGYGRAGQRIQDVLHTDLLTAVRRGILENSDGELRLLVRSIEDYDRDFLKRQFLAVIRRSWTEREEAIQNFCRWMGFRRTGSIIDETARSLINGLLRENRIEASGAQLIRRV